MLLDELIVLQYMSPKAVCYK